MLQKWIIERKVTRADRISRHGQPWARLGTLDDLAPFFDVVDEADRARAAVGRGSTSGAAGDGGMGRSGAAASGFGLGGLQTPAAGLGRAPSEGSGSLPRSTPESQRAVNRSLELLAVEAPVPTDEPDTSIVMRPSSGRAWWKLLVTFSVAGGVFYFGIRALPALMVKGMKVGASQVTVPAAAPTLPEASPPVVAPAPELAGTPPTGAEAVAPGALPPGSTPNAAESAAATADPGTAPSPNAVAPVTAGPGEGVGGVAASAPAVIPAAPAPAAVEVPPAPAAATPPRAPREKADKAHGRTRGALAAQGQGDELPYDRLVAQADRLLENGGNERALRLYERALVLRPDAPEALTGIGYVHLDRNRTGSAIEFFTRASAASPFAPALFGLGQAYRAAGDPGRARQTYQRYLALYPTGSDASAAERQLQALAQPGSTAEAPGTILHEGGAGEGARPADPK